jgi:branched-chain amino acid aminotransferase
MQIMIRTWHITPSQTIDLDLQAASLDEATRQLPDGFYSTFRTFDGCRRVLGLTSHLQRLYEPVPAPEVDESLLRRRLLGVLEPFRPGEARVRAIMTREGHAFLAVEPLTPLPRQVYEQGVRVETTELQREHPRLKYTTFIGKSNSERKQIAEKGIFEALLVKKGKILEGMTSNFFYAKYHRTERNERRQGATNVVEARAASASQQAWLPAHDSHDAFREREVILGTAGDDVLLGITRETVIDIARDRGLEVKDEPLKRDQIGAIQEAFLTSSSRGVVPVVMIDQVAIGQGRPGPVTKALAGAYDAYVIEKAEPIL